MRRQLGGAMGVVLMAAATAAASDEHVARRAGRDDAPRLLKEAVRAFRDDVFPALQTAGLR